MGLSGIDKLWLHLLMLNWSAWNSLDIVEFNCERANNIIGGKCGIVELSGIDWNWLVSERLHELIGMLSDITEFVPVYDLAMFT